MASFVVNEKIETYAKSHSTPPEEIFLELEKETHKKMDLPQMLTGILEGRFLKMLVQITQAKRVLEIGTFTGYGTLWMAEGLCSEGKIITCDVDPKHLALARTFFDCSPHGQKIEIQKGNALKTLKTLQPEFDFIFIDADKVNYPNYYEESLRLLRRGGLLALDNMLWGGSVLDPKDQESRTLHKLNEKIAGDSRVEAVLLTVRDGIQLVRKRDG